MLKTGVLAFALFVGIAGSASISNAGPYGDFSSPSGTVQFLNVSDLNGLYGAPTVSGNNLDFSPANFVAACPGTCLPNPPAIAADTLTFEIKALPGQIIDTVIMTESGDTTLTSILNAVASTSVFADVFIDVRAVNGVPVNGLSDNAQMVFLPGQNFSNSSSGLTSITTQWSGLLNFNVNDVITANGGTGQATHVEITLSNTLTALAANGASAQIRKKDVDGLAITVVPEPGAALFMGLGLLGLSSLGRGSRES